MRRTAPNLIHTIKFKLFISMLVLGVFPFVCGELLGYYIIARHLASEVHGRLERVHSPAVQQEALDRISHYAADQARVFASMTLMGTALIFVGGFFFLNRWISKPILRLTEGVKALGSGEIEAELEAIDIRSNDEIGQLAAAFKQMVRDLKAREEKQRELQEQLIQADRLASLGELSAGIAHEIGNPLTAIKTTAQVMEEEMEADSPHREYLRRIIKEIDRLNRILKAFFSFAKPQRPQHTWCDLRGLVQEVIFLINQDAARQRVTIREEYHPDLPAIEVDYQQIQQVLLNLCLNALQAMHQGGQLLIRGGPAPPEEGAAVRLSVVDTGKGIAPEHLKKIFNPFFTTRSQGTGLGLSIAYQIVDKHGGKIQVESQPGRGTAFAVILPVKSPSSLQEAGNGKLEGGDLSTGIPCGESQSVSCKSRV